MQPEEPSEIDWACRHWDNVADAWHRWRPVISAWLKPATDVMLRLSGVGPGCQVLDVAAGIGDQTIQASRVVGTNGHLVAIDSAPSYAAIITSAANAMGATNFESRVMNAESLDFPEATFDAVICRLGLMLFYRPRTPHRSAEPYGEACSRNSFLRAGGKSPAAREVSSQTTGRQNAPVHLQHRFKLGQPLGRPAEGSQAIGHVVQAMHHVGMVALKEPLAHLQGLLILGQRHHRSAQGLQAAAPSGACSA